MAEENMIGLLVSVRDESEAKVVLNQMTPGSCLRLIDVKEPQNGPLGQADSIQLRNIGQLCTQHDAMEGNKNGLSVALGEAVNLKPNARIFADKTILRGFNFAKMGLSGLGGEKKWWVRWEKLLAAIPPQIKSVAVAYADYPDCNSPAPIQVASVGRRVGCQFVLLDTFTKDGSCLFDFMPLAEVKQFVEKCRNSGQTVVIAGSLGQSNLRTAVMCQPNFIGVRGAVCEFDRTSSVSKNRLANFDNLLVNVQSKIKS